ncbi:MAG: carbon-nitrogen hydrolase family protein [Burkholderiales bacterium]
MDENTFPLRVAAVQLRLELGSVSRNLAQAEALSGEAFTKGAEWVILPEFFPSGVAYSEKMHSAWLPIDGPALELMRRQARKYGGVVGGSFIAKSGTDCFNSFLLVFPNGQYYRHDKDIPTMWENCYYIGGEDDGVLPTPIGPIGVAMCWEMIRSQTLRRLKGRVSFVVGGSCWWDLAFPVPDKYRDQQLRLVQILKDAPSSLAEMLGVPFVHASQVGEFEGTTPGEKASIYASRYLGESQIVDGGGNVLARMSADDGEGVIAATIDRNSSALPTRQIPQGFWTVDLPPIAQRSWDFVNEFGKKYYTNEFKRVLETRD